MLSRIARLASPIVLACALGACGGGGGDGGQPAAATTVYATPVAVNTSQAFTRVESSGQHACGITTDGSTWCWGHDDNGQLGVAASPGTCNGSPCSATPVRLESPLRFVALAAGLGPGMTCGLVATGEAWCWGFGIGGQLGDGRRVSSRSPVAVAGGLQFQRIRVSPSSLGACGQLADGAIHCWGALGLLFGNGASGEVHAAPVRVDWGALLVDFDLGEQHACGVTAAQEVVCWGSNFYGQLGIGSAGALGGINQAARPQRVVGLVGAGAVVAGSDTSCALKTDGTAFCWGNGAHTGASAAAIYAGTPLPVDGALRFTSLHAGYLQNCGLTAAGQAWCWGSNLVGDLGDGSQVDSRVPVRVQGSVPFASLSRRPSCGVVGSGTATCWGNNTYGQVGRAP